MGPEHTSHFVEEEALERYAAGLAERLDRLRLRRARLKSKRRACVRTIESSCRKLRRRYDGTDRIPDACRWLLDNEYLARQEALGIRRDLAEAGVLRHHGPQALILELCRALTDCGEGAVDPARIEAFLRGFQSVCPLRRRELELLGACLRLALLERLARLCDALWVPSEGEEAAREMEAVFSSLRLLSVTDPEPLLRRVDLTDRILSEDPTGDYAHMDPPTRAAYLRRAAKLARAQGLEEQEYARRLVDRARAEGRHLGFLLFREPGQLGAGLYIGANVLLSLGLSLLLGFSLRSAWTALLLLLPVSELVKSAGDFLLGRLIPARRMFRMDPEEGVPDGAGTICVVSALLTDPESAEAMAGRLEELRLCCRQEGRRLQFGLLADLKEAGEKETAEDEQILLAAETVVNRLNRRYGGGFFLFTRERSFDGEVWTGWERKRGALLELSKLLCDESSALRVTGDRDALVGTRYILTLDSDTRMLPGAAGELIAAMRHPLNRPRLDETRHVVIRGRGLIQPRLSTEMSGARATDFSLIFAGAGGSDPYGGLCGQLYMDAFGSGGFAGKGILDAECLLRCSEGRIRPGRVLSHDAVEGALLRGAFLGDAEFSDAFPARPGAYYKRQHRWIRGDWQNLPFLFCRDFAPMDRWRLFDNLRRSLLPAGVLLNLLAGFLLPDRGLKAAAWAALLAMLSRLFTALAEGSLRTAGQTARRSAARIFSGLGGAIVESFLRLWLLPYETLVCLSAVATALWRMLISHRRLLQWRTAAQSAGDSGRFSACLRAMWPAAALGLGLLLFSPAVIGRSAGLLWLLSPALAFALGLPAQSRRSLSAADRAYLKNHVKQALNYYLDLCTEGEHFLPPDNFQEQPPTGAAHRTSPTNIGLMLLSLAGAAELELLGRAEAGARIAKTLDTLERLEKHGGHLYNWYDTRTLEPLRPALVSTVDSGNLAACLLTLSRILGAWEEAELSRRASALYEAMDFRLLYDGQRQLFNICYDPVLERGAGGWYDLMASEAMLTSYLAVARGQVPVRHWRRLSRARLQKDGVRGLASWTGTMFEYLMPALFLPPEPGSLFHEACAFCLYAQKRRVPAGEPWGVSESAFYALDPGLSYRYKASGVQALALKRGQDEDLVVSPYSSFLALALDPVGAVRNLRRLERLGAVGRWGFCEALDFTPERCRGREAEKVWCWMAHHVGMSVLAGINALGGDGIRWHFLSDPAMGAFTLLLQERADPGTPPLRRDPGPAPERPARTREEPWRLDGEPGGRRCLLSGGVYDLLLDDRGRARAGSGDRTVYGSPDLEKPGLSLTVSRDGSPTGEPERFRFTEDRALFFWPEHRLERFVSGRSPGEGLRLELSPRRSGRFRITVPAPLLLCNWRDYVGHPAFWELGIQALPEERGLLLRRLRRGELPEQWACLRCDREVLVRTDPPALSLELRLEEGEKTGIAFALGLGDSPDAARRAAEQILRDPDPARLPGAVAQRLGMSAADFGETMALLPDLSRPLSGAAAKRELWPFGVSGDLPLLCCPAGAPEALPLLKSWLLLKSCGLESDLVFLSGEAGEYRQPLRSRIRELLVRQGLEALLDSPGGVRFVPKQAQGVLMSRAAVRIGQPSASGQALALPELSRARKKGKAPEHQWQEGAFCFTVRDDLPGRAWQLPLSNGRLSAIACDCGPGALWMENARLCRLIPPMDPRSTGGEEMLWLRLGDRAVSLFAANDGFSCRVRYEPGLATWEKELPTGPVTTETWIPPEGDFRVLRIRGARGLSLIWALRPRLSDEDSAGLRCRLEDGLFRAENPDCPWPELRFLAGSGSFFLGRTDFRPAALRMELEAEEETLLVCGCGAERELRRLCTAEGAARSREEALAFWREKCFRLRLETGSPALDHYLNGWAVYQTLCCRLWGRGSLYQSGGAYGFRDQLQDAVNLLPVDPGLARERILDACRHQYAQGDVMHWWHPLPDGDRGIRSRCGDDLLWLPWALAEYVRATGDEALCFREEPVLLSPPLRKEERDRYETAEAGPGRTVLAHAESALLLAESRGTGPHGLPFFGSGDWNDGLDAVDGESLWLGWFLAYTARTFARLLDRLGQPGAGRWRTLAGKMEKACESGWNGRWYDRGYWTDGEALGGRERIDSLAQSWAALCPNAHGGRVRLALEEACQRLADEEKRLVKLFSPPFGPEERYPGYLAGYGAGFRENGGQYTHAGAWLALALLRRGEREKGRRLLELLLAEGREPDRYEAEPFVLAADVCAAPGHEGEAGWTWYTGSAGWFFRTALEELAGLRLEDGRLRRETRENGIRAFLDGAEL